ncbi:hypothetical protein GCM10009753_64890 [Streptantibioticus ferralitis]
MLWPRIASGRKAHWWDEYQGKTPPSFLAVSVLKNDAPWLRTVQTAHPAGARWACF